MLQELEGAGIIVCMKEELWGKDITIVNQALLFCSSSLVC